MIQIKSRERSSILKNLKTGLVPRVGIRHIQVGRAREIKSIICDLQDIEQGGTCFRIVIGDYGSGKTFFLSLLKEIAHQKNICVCSASLTPGKRLYSSSNHSRALYTEMVRQLSTKLKPNGNALQTIIEKYLSNTSQNHFDEKLNRLTDFTLGFDFIKVLKAYKIGFDQGNNDQTSAALKWFRGEYTSKIEAKQDLGIRTIISDENYYEALKVLAAFLLSVGYSGLLICLDEMVNLLRISHAVTRKNNYEQFLVMLNDTMQENTASIGFFISGTPEFLTDERRGLYAYEALKSRLEENEFLQDGMFDDKHPVIRLQPLSKEDIFNLVKKVGSVYEADPSVQIKVDDSIIGRYLEHCSAKLGAQLLLSPRTVIRSYLNLRDAIKANPAASIDSLLGQTVVQPDVDPMLAAPDLPAEDQDLADFKLQG